jgi:hypothetical protein
MNNKNLLGKTLLIVGFAMFVTANANAKEPSGLSQVNAVRTASVGNCGGSCHYDASAKDSAGSLSLGLPQADVTGVAANSNWLETCISCNAVASAKNGAGIQQGSILPQAKTGSAVDKIDFLKPLVTAKVGYINCGANGLVQSNNGEWLQRVSIATPNMIEPYSASVSIPAPTREQISAV